VEYRIHVVAMAFRIHAAPDKFSSRPRIQNRRLKLLQFIAMRPWLVPVIRDWSSNRHDAQLSMISEEGLKRGFITDSVHEHVVDFLTAAGVLRRDEQYVISGTNSSFIAELYSQVLSQSLFGAELTALRQLENIVITNEMLEGW
jgi:hypothetical protein